MNENLNNLTKVIDEALLIFDDVKKAITDKGVEVAEGTPTSDYKNKISEVFDAGADSVAPDIEEQTTRLNDGLAGGNSNAQTMREKIYEDGFAAGKKSEYDAFWGTKTTMGVGEFAGRRWTNETFKPPHNLVASTNINYAFYNSGIAKGLGELENELGITITLTNLINCQSVFSFSFITSIREIGLKSGSMFIETFAHTTHLKKIEKMILPDDGTARFTNAFQNCQGLESLTIEGPIGQKGFDVSWSSLNKASLISVVNALSTTTTGLTVTLRLDAVNKAFETSTGASDGSTSDEWLTLAATKSNWTISLINS